MRRLRGTQFNPNTNTTEGDTTLEHIVPQVIDTNKLQYYDTEQLRTVGGEKEIVLTREFTHKINPSYPPYPHTVSYKNLVASCTGTFPSKGTSNCCCNNIRGNEEAFPVYYLQNPEDYVEYTITGNIFAKESRIKDKVSIMISHVKLNTQSLVDIRQMWYLLRNETMADLESCATDIEKRNLILSKVLYVPTIDSNRRKIMLRKFVIANEWETLMLYDIFHSIMRRLYP